MNRNEVQKPSLAKFDIEGLSVLTSEQCSDLERYLANIKSSYEKFMFDGDMYDALKVVFAPNGKVTTAMAQSIKDHHCTKLFYNVPDTLGQTTGFAAPSVRNGLWNENVRAACALVVEQLQITKLSPICVDKEEDLYEVWSTPKASAGAIKLGSSKKDSIKECFDAVQKIGKMVRSGEEPESIQIPAIPFHRAQISGFSVDGEYRGESLKKKDRLVWGLDGGTVSYEGRFAKPLIEHVSKVWFGYAGGKSPELLRSLIRKSLDSKMWWTSVDYSKFDQTIPDWLIEWCFSQIKRFFDETYHKELDWIAYNFINTKIAIPGRGIFCKHKGIPSGSNFTQLVGSMANAVMAMAFIASNCTDGKFQDKINYVKKELSSHYHSDLSMFVMGDDNIMFTSTKLDMKAFSSYVNHMFGVVIHPDKCDSGSRSEDPMFLKRRWEFSGEYQDPIYLTINVSHPERPRSYKGYSPWHIIYGLYLTYQNSFPNTVTERKLAELMEQNGGIKALESIPQGDLPGVFRAFGHDAMRQMVSRAERLLLCQ